MATYRKCTIPNRSTPIRELISPVKQQLLGLDARRSRPGPLTDMVNLIRLRRQRPCPNTMPRGRPARASRATIPHPTLPAAELCGRKHARQELHGRDRGGTDRDREDVPRVPSRPRGRAAQVDPSRNRWGNANALVHERLTFPLYTLSPPQRPSPFTDQTLHLTDPIFFVHHAQIDRLWWKWQQRHRQEEDKEEGPQTRLHAYDSIARHPDSVAAAVSLNDPLELFGLGEDKRVEDVMSIRSALLCYKYPTA